MRKITSEIEAKIERIKENDGGRREKLNDRETETKEERSIENQSYKINAEMDEKRNMKTDNERKSV